MMECKNALEKTKGDEEKAIKILRQKGEEVVAKKSEREVKQGIVETYIHTNKKIGAILELFCETDFVARNEQFQELAHDLVMHIAAMEPENEEHLLSQPFIKNPEQTIEELINQAIAKLGENIKIGRFVRFEI